jgi:hypothetical protein
VITLVLVVTTFFTEHDQIVVAIIEGTITFVQQMMYLVWGAQPNCSCPFLGSDHSCSRNSLWTTLVQSNDNFLNRGNIEQLKFGCTLNRA